MTVRPMQPGDLDAVLAVVEASLWGPLGGRRAWQLRRVGHLLERDPGGAWVAERDGRITGAALALLREGIWGLSLFGVLEAERGRGTGRALLDAALTHGPARGGIVLSSEHPGAMRLYARAGFDLRPCVSLAGHVRTPPPAPAGVRDGSPADHGWMDAIGRMVRGAGYAIDVPTFLEHSGRLRCVEGRGFAVAVGGDVKLLAASGEDAAVALLQDAMLGAGGAPVSVEFLASGQDWAIRAGLEAGLVLSPGGPLFTRGELGTLAPWVPSGAYL